MNHQHTFADQFLIHILNDPKLAHQYFKENASFLNCREVESLANMHGMLPILYKTIKNSSSPYYTSLQNTTNKAYHKILHYNLLLTGSLLTVLSHLEDKGFHYISIKGPALSEELYGDISIRQYSDIDLLVNERDMVHISNLLISLGYQPLLPIQLLQNKKFLSLDNDFSFRHTCNGVLLELHWSLFPKRHKISLPFSELYSRSKMIRLKQHKIRTLSPEDNLLYLTLHGAKHIFERYEWVSDLNHLIKTYPNIDLLNVYKKAKDIRVETPFLLGIFLSQELLDTAIPAELEQYHTLDIEHLITKVLNYYHQGFVFWDEPLKKRARFLFLADLNQRKDSKILSLFGSLFKTTPVDVITFQLPNKIAFFYPLLRPFRLIYKYVLKKNAK